MIFVYCEDDDPEFEKYLNYCLGVCVMAERLMQIIHPELSDSMEDYYEYVMSQGEYIYLPDF